MHMMRWNSQADEIRELHAFYSLFKPDIKNRQLIVTSNSY